MAQLSQSNKNDSIDSYTKGALFRGSFAKKKYVLSPFLSLSLLKSWHFSSRLDSPELASITFLSRGGRNKPKPKERRQKVEESVHQDLSPRDTQSDWEDGIDDGSSGRRDGLKWKVLEDGLRLSWGSELEAKHAFGRGQWNRSKPLKDQPIDGSTDRWIDEVGY